ncbi:MAG: bifunctional pyr operon transcriptional regulator/uracil phosphoribosyltransferase PyrR [Bacteroidia bacterium]
MGAAKILREGDAVERTLDRMTYEVMELWKNPRAGAIIALLPRGKPIAQAIHGRLQRFFSLDVPYGELDISFFRDDLRQNIVMPQPSYLPFSVENKEIVLIDDVIHTGRTVRAALDALFVWGRPERVYLAVLVDRESFRQLPIMPHIRGLTVQTYAHEKVRVRSDPFRIEIHDLGS